jgi:FkbM family methyltransferase
MDAATIRAFRYLLPRSADRDATLIRLGSAYGGWWIPADAVKENSVAYCVGAGEDITFDLALLDAGCVVRTIDPTPRSIEYVGGLAIIDDRYRFVPLALWNETGTLRLFTPKNPEHVSHSALNLQQTEAFIDVQSITFDDLVSSIGDESVDLLKMDIEGAEIVVLPQILASPHSPRVLCVEFDAWRPVKRLRATVRTVLNHDFRVVRVEGRNVTFVRRETGDGCLS